VAIMNCIPKDATPGGRVAALASEVAEQFDKFVDGTLAGADLLMFQNMSAPQCWDAALYCAWAAKGVECANVRVNGNPGDFGVTSFNNYTRIFGTSPPSANTIHELMTMPGGCFVGFVDKTTAALKHCMLHISNGQGAGNKSGCVLSAANGSGFGWEKLDMAKFFTTDRNLNTNANTKIIYRACTGQTI
jgi:hypothetical protein